MKPLEWTVALGACLLISAQAAAPSSGTESAWNGPGGLAQGLERMRSLCGEGQPTAAREVGAWLLTPGVFSSWRRELELEGESWWLPVLSASDPLLDYLRLNGRTRRERAHVHYAMGVVAQAMPEEPVAPDVARAEFEFASARAGVGPLREDATYNLGTLAFEEGEAWRAQMPEFGGTPPAPVAPAMPPMPGAQEETPPEPLDEARTSYLKAKQSFTLRLRMNWQDADTRANTELVMRRLRDLDEIERQREQQQQEQEEQEQQDSEENDEDKQEQDEQDQEQQSEGEDEQQPEEPQDPEQQEGEDEQEEDEPEPEPQPSEEEEDPEAQKPEEQETEAQQEIFLTKEEVQRLLERLQRHEEQGEELRERRRGQRRPTARDW